MDKPQVFNHPMFGELPVIVVDGVEWFGATEAAKSLSFSNPYTAIPNHVDEDDLTDQEVIDSLGRKQQKKFTNESGLYSLIFGAAKQGNNPEIKSKAKAYKRWVTAEVLPSIRKTGSYSIQQQYQLPQNYVQALEALVAAEKYKVALEEQNAYKDAQLKLQEPKVALYDVAMSAEGSQPVGTVAKELGLGRTRLFAFLRDKKILRHNNEPYQEYIERGYFKLRMYTITHNTAGLENKTQTMVTPKGIAWLHKILQEQKQAN